MGADAGGGDRLRHADFRHVAGIRVLTIES